MIHSLFQQLPTPEPVPSLKTWGTLAVAVIALVQPWLIALFKRVFRKGDIDIHPTMRIEVGYSGFGPTIGLTGTLHAVHRDQFVKNVTVWLKKQKDGSQHDFSWVVFRSPTISLGGGRSDTSVEMVSGFLVGVTQPYRYNILFQDTATQLEMQRYINSIQDTWKTAVSTTAHESAAALHETLMSNGSFTDDYTSLDRQMYWEPGTYKLVLTVNTARPDRSFTEGWLFDLQPDDIRLLRLNTVSIVHQASGQDPTYNFAWADYQEERY